MPQQIDSPDGSETNDTLIDLSLPQHHVSLLLESRSIYFLHCGRCESQHGSYFQSDATSNDDTLSNWSFQSEHTNGFQSIIEDK